MALSNPYRSTTANADLQVVTFRVSSSDWLRLWHCSPTRGLMDRVMSTLFHKLIRSLELNSIPPHPDHVNTQKIADLIDRVAFPQAPGTGPSNPVRRPAPRVERKDADRTGRRRNTPSNQA